MGMDVRRVAGWRQATAAIIPTSLGNLNAA